MSGMSTGFRAQQLGHAGIWDSDRHNAGELVRVASNMDKDENHTGASRLPQFVLEENQSVNFLIDSNDRFNGTPFDFTVNMGSNLFRARQLHLSRAIIPKLYNVNRKNNVIRWRWKDASTDYIGPLTSILSTGYYGVDGLANEIASKMNDLASLSGAPEGTAILCQYDHTKGNFFLQFLLGTGVGGGSTLGSFYIIDDSSFILRGRNLAPFPAFPDGGTSGGDPTGSQFRQFGFNSGIAGMIYTRYITLHSAAVNQFAFASSRMSRGTGDSDLIAIFDVAGQLASNDTFAGTFISDTTIETDSPNIQIVNPMKQFIKFLDFRVRDEFGDVLDGIFPVDDITQSTAVNEMGIVFYLYVTF